MSGAGRRGRAGASRHPTFDGTAHREKLSRKLVSGLGRGRTATIAKWREEKDAVADIERLLVWCDSHGLSVEFNNDANGNYFEKEIEISSRVGLVRQRNYLLHEIGHYMVERGVYGPKSVDLFPYGYSINERSNDTRSLEHKTDIVFEELEAWHRGWKLAKRLKLNVSQRSYYKERSQSVKTYLKWAVRRGGSKLQ